MHDLTAQERQLATNEVWSTSFEFRIKSLVSLMRPALSFYSLDDEYCHLMQG